jgi:pimeloyl-ACP methyl ester carboxylesterase
MFPAGVAHVDQRWVSLPGGPRLRVAESGERGRRTVLLIHGWGASLYMWRDWFAPFADAGWHVLAVDLPGHGLSDKPPGPECYRIESLVSTVRALLDAEGLASVDVVAQSMAGTIAVELCTGADARIRRTVLINPACFGRIRMRRLFQLVSPPAVNALLPRLVARRLVSRIHRMVYGNPSRITPRDEEEYWAPSQFPSYARAMRGLLHEFRWARPPAAEMAARLRAARETILVVLGTRDRLVLDAAPYVSRLQALGAPLDVTVVDGGGHAVNEERADEVAGLALEFLGRESV